MKKLFVSIVAGLIVCGSVLAVVLKGSGFGWSGTATTTATILEGFSANSVSVNTAAGGPTLFALVNVTTNDFNARLTAGTCVPIPTGVAFTFDAQQRGNIDRVVFATTNSTANVSIGSY